MTEVSDEKVSGGEMKSVVMERMSVVMEADGDGRKLVVMEVGGDGRKSVGMEGSRWGWKEFGGDGRKSVVMEGNR